jgi:hypothetical protein
VSFISIFSFSIIYLIVIYLGPGYDPRVLFLFYFLSLPLDWKLLMKIDPCVVHTSESGFWVPFFFFPCNCCLRFAMFALSDLISDFYLD